MPLFVIQGGRLTLIDLMHVNYGKGRSFSTNSSIDLKCHQSEA